MVCEAIKQIPLCSISFSIFVAVTSLCCSDDKSWSHCPHDFCWYCNLCVTSWGCTHFKQMQETPDRHHCVHICIVNMKNTYLLVKYVFVSNARQLRAINTPNTVVTAVKSHLKFKVKGVWLFRASIYHVLLGHFALWFLTVPGCECEAYWMRVMLLCYFVHYCDTVLFN